MKLRLRDSAGKRLAEKGEGEGETREAGAEAEGEGGARVEEVVMENAVNAIAVSLPSLLFLFCVRVVIPSPSETWAISGPLS
mgnify:CR=1 FL=1